MPEVLRLLSNTRKTGLLALDGDRGVGNVWLRDGSIIDARSDHERSGDIDSTLFDLLRFGIGDFVFEPDAAPDDHTTDEIDVEAALGRAETLLVEWRELESIVPSLRVGVRLVQELSGESVTITSDQWRSLAAVGSGTSAAGLGQRLELGELDTCRRIRDLVEASLVEVSDDAPEPEAPEPAERETVTAPRVNGWEGEADLVDHDLSTDEVASLGTNLASFVARPSEETEPALTGDQDQEGVEESADETPATGFETAELPASDDDADDFLAQLTNLSPKAAAAIEATAEEAAGRTPDEMDSAAPAVPEPSTAPEGDEEINRNLLLKFLSSTKN